MLHYKYQKLKYMKIMIIQFYITNIKKMNIVALMRMQTGESGEAELPVDEDARRAAPGPWERRSQDWEQGSQDSMEKGQREREGKIPIPFLGTSGTGVLSGFLLFLETQQKGSIKKSYKPRYRS